MTTNDSQIWTTLHVVGGFENLRVSAAHTRSADAIHLTIEDRRRSARLTFSASAQEIAGLLGRAKGEVARAMSEETS